MTKIDTFNAEHSQVLKRSVRREGLPALELPIEMRFDLFGSMNANLILAGLAPLFIVLFRLYWVDYRNLVLFRFQQGRKVATD